MGFSKLFSNFERHPMSETQSLYVEIKPWWAEGPDAKYRRQKLSKLSEDRLPQIYSYANQTTESSHWKYCPDTRNVHQSSRMTERKGDNTFSIHGYQGLPQPEIEYVRVNHIRTPHDDPTDDPLDEQKI